MNSLLHLTLDNISLKSFSSDDENYRITLVVNHNLIKQKCVIELNIIIQIFALKLNHAQQLIYTCVGENM
jgi:hypothetical protein